MNLTFPIADWFFGTSDLKRGLRRHALQRLRHEPPARRTCAASPGVRMRRRRADGQLLTRRAAIHAERRQSHRLAVVTLLVAMAFAYWEATMARRYLLWFVIGFAVFAVVAMWIFPEASVKKGDMPPKQR